MRLVQLGKVAEIEREGVAADRILSGTPYLGLEHIETGGRILSQASVSEGELASTKFRFSPEHVLYGKLRPYLAKIAMPDFAGICSTDIVPIRPGPDLDRRYLAYFLRQPSMVAFANSRATGANLPRLSPKVLAEFQIPLPPLVEQRRIAAILDQADELRRLRHQAIARVSDLALAEFEQSFGSIQPAVPFEMAVSDTLIGLVRGAEEFGSDFLTPYVRMDAISPRGEYLEGKVQNTTVTGAELSRYQLESGDLLFNTRNSKELVGKTAIYRGSGPATFNNNIMRIRFRPGWESAFVDAYLRSRVGQKELSKRKSGTTSVWAVYWSQLKSLPLPAVAPDLQKAFRMTVNKAWDHGNRLRDQAAKLDVLFASLQNRAFRGEL